MENKININGVDIKLANGSARIYNDNGEHLDLYNGQMVFDSMTLNCVVVVRDGMVIGITKDVETIRRERGMKK